MQQPAPAAIVLCQNVTGLATMRALSQVGVKVHCFLLEPHSFARFSRYSKKIVLYDKQLDEFFLLRFLIEYCENLGSRPVVFPSSDTMALFLAKHADQLRSYCTFSSNTYAEMVGLVSKDGLYRLAAAAGVSTIPSIVTQDADEIAAWSRIHPAPYLLKPFYVGIDTFRPFVQNMVLATREDLLMYVANYGTRSVIVQRMIAGGDGHIFDCYGYCDHDGRVLSMATHRRLRQEPPDFGSTCFGEIPANFGTETDRQIFHDTEQLLGKVRYHGIFGIEWLHERETDKFYLIDFNARPFLTIGHLHACGLNLPALAYRELTGRLLDKVIQMPVLQHMLWIDLLRDMSTLHESEANFLTAVSVWLTALWRCRSFAYLSWRDPGPGIAQILMIVRTTSLYLARKLLGKERRAQFRAQDDMRQKMRRPGTFPP